MADKGIFIRVAVKDGDKAIAELRLGEGVRGASRELAGMARNALSARNVLASLAGTAGIGLLALAVDAALTSSPPPPPALPPVDAEFNAMAAGDRLQSSRPSRASWSTRPASWRPRGRPGVHDAAATV